MRFVVRLPDGNYLAERGAPCGVAGVRAGGWELATVYTVLHVADGRLETSPALPARLGGGEGCEVVPVSVVLTAEEAARRMAQEAARVRAEAEAQAGPRFVGKGTRVSAGDVLPNGVSVGPGMQATATGSGRPGA